MAAKEKKLEGRMTEAEAIKKQKEKAQLELLLSTSTAKQEKQHHSDRKSVV